MTAETIAVVLSALGAGAVLREVISAIAQRRRIGADAVSVISAAARELVEPLRQELANERQDHAAEIAAERQQIADLRDELAACRTEVRSLRQELAAASVEADGLRRARVADQQRIRDLEAQLHP